MKRQVQPQFVLPISTADGEFVAGYSHAGLCHLSFPTPQTGRAAGSGPVPSRVLGWHRLTSAAVTRALAGQPTGKLPPLDLSAGTEFQQAVWRALGEITLGNTKSYGELARRLRKPKALRAVGGACGANPVPVLLPCHRVLAANGRLGGFSGGLGWKRRLLGREGVSWVEPSPAR